VTNYVVTCVLHYLEIDSASFSITLCVKIMKQTVYSLCTVIISRDFDCFTLKFKANCIAACIFLFTFV